MRFHERHGSRISETTVNGYSRIQLALTGQPPQDGTPVMLHNFMMAAREAGVSMERYRNDPAALARCHIHAVETYGYDGVLVDVDTATLAGAMGVPVVFPADEPAVATGARLGSLEAIAELEAEPAAERVARYPGVQVWLEAVRLLVGYFGGEVYIRGNCDQCPFALAGVMRGSADWMMDIVDPANEAAAHRVLEYAAGATIGFIKLMAEAGAHMVSNGDSPAGPSVVSPAMYRKFAAPYERRIVEAAHGLGLPYTLHICGKTEPILADMVATGADALEIDHKTDARRAREVIGGRSAFIGNIDPTGLLAHGSPAEVARATRELRAVFAGEPRLIVNAGCAIPADTPGENLRAMIEAAHRAE
jgi:uroporphyrinogen decarboxylase